MKFEWFLSLRYLSGNRKLGFISIRTFFSVAGVFLGSTVLVVALSIANGFEKEVRDRIVGTLAHAKIIRHHGEPIVPYDSLRQCILTHPKVIGAAPFISGKGGVEYDNVQEGVLVMGVDAALESTVTDLGRSIKYGEFYLDSLMSRRGRKFPGILIGSGLARKMGVLIGGEMVVISLATIDATGEPVPKMARYVVSGIFETGMYEYDLNLIYISIESAQELFMMKGVEGIQIKTIDLFKADNIAREVVDTLQGYPYYSVDWKMQNRSLFEWMALEKLVIFLVISLIILVASFNIISSLIMIIIEKRREIGVLMSLGSTTGAVMRIFILNGAIIGVVGSTFGVIFGVILCLIQYHYQIFPLPGDIYFIDKLPVLIRAVDVIAIYLAANILCLLATVYPAYQASIIRPAESIRYE
jgi:lipoprotein-releasing system permease protein